jgi:hypothetical protein
MGNGVTEIRESAFKDCSSLTDIALSNSLTKIGMDALAYCEQLTNIFIPAGVAKIPYRAFSGCSNMAFYDFSSHNSVPTLEGQNAFYKIPSDCKIIVPDALYNEWIVAQNWSAFVSNIIKKSEWDLQNG